MEKEVSTVKIIQKEHGLFDIEADGQIIGCGSMMVDEDSCYLERIDIDEEHRGKGYGTQALYLLRDIYGTYYLAADNADAKRLYDRIADEMPKAEYDRWGFAIDQGFGVHVID